MRAAWPGTNSSPAARRTARSGRQLFDIVNQGSAFGPSLTLRERSGPALPASALSAAASALYVRIERSAWPGRGLCPVPPSDVRAGGGRDNNNA
jgi:hypothetical protein